MEDWMPDGNLLRRILDVASELVDSGRVVLQTATLAAQGDHGAGPGGEPTRTLACAIRQLRELLQQVPSPARAAGDGAEEAALASSRAASPSAGAERAPAPTTLLHLPDDLLTRIGHMSGKHSRTVCGRLRDVYGAPSLTLKQPRSVLELETLGAWNGAIAYHQGMEGLRRVGLEAAYAQLSSVWTLGAVRSCSARWPGWAAQVTRLELSDTCQLDVPTLRAIHESLPGLQQLSLPLEYVSNSHPSVELPQPPCLTQLCMLCSARTLQRATREQAYGLELLAAAPNLRSLHLDLRFRSLRQDTLQQALRPLAHLTHLELACDGQGAEHAAQRRRAVRGALASLGDWLRSLVFLSPTEHLGKGMGTVLQSLTCLTRLGQCVGWASRAGVDSVVGAGDWLQVPASLRQLVLGYSSAGDRAADPAAVRQLALAAAGGSVLHALQVLVLPVMGDYGERDTEASMQHLKALLSVVAERCPALTSLRCGFSVNRGAVEEGCLEMDERLHWLAPLGRLQRLRQLTLTLNGFELETLAHLAGLPLLAELWLRVDTPGFLSARQRRAGPGYQPGGGLVQLTSLQHLAVFVMAYRGVRCSEDMVQALLPAALALPRLQVLDLSAAEAFTSFPELWLPLAASPPSHLRDLRVCSPRGSSYSKDVQEVVASRSCYPCDLEKLATHRRTLALLKAHLPQRIAVSGAPGVRCQAGAALRLGPGAQRAV